MGPFLQGTSPWDAIAANCSTAHGQRSGGTYPQSSILQENQQGQCQPLPETLAYFSHQSACYRLHPQPHSLGCLRPRHQLRPLLLIKAIHMARRHHALHHSPNRLRRPRIWISLFILCQPCLLHLHRVT